MVANLLKHAANLPVAPFCQRHLVPGIFLVHRQLDVRRLGHDAEAAALHARLLLSACARQSRLGWQQDAVAQLINLFFRRLARHLHHVRLGHVGAGARQLRHQVAVVRQQQQAFAHVIQPAHGEDPLFHVLQQVHHRRTTLGIAYRGHRALGLVQRNVNVALRSLQQFSVHANFVKARIGLAARLGDDVSVHAHQSCGDQLFGLAARGQPGGGQNFL